MAVYDIGDRVIAIQPSDGNTIIVDKAGTVVDADENGKVHGYVYYSVLFDENILDEPIDFRVWNFFVGPDEIEKYLTPESTIEDDPERFI